ncbi:hypothetical protein [Fluviicola chungangensis]|uniref:Uncharacterized protein n=1 Tax=Fluviicola chungangensis TaxID=2597671 RepID=A0A556MZZ1_9FLAO|nr:hypothetical protein [Fluviicola chungangensis]TSJ45500.1 hypothetical protein FO442_07015 [Fluviicola chungangensis]
MERSLTSILLLFLMSWMGYQNRICAQTDTSNSDNIPRITKKELRKYTRTFDTFLVGARVNYLQGKYGFLGLAGTFMWHEIGYIPESHIGLAAGMDFRLTKSMVYAPKITFEYRYQIGVVRVGYTCFTDFKSEPDHRISAEIGFSLLSFLDITYLHAFGSDRNPFFLGNDYFNLVATIPLNL